VIRYLLDTDTCSYIAKRSQPSVLQRFARLRAEDCAISSISYAEILYRIAPWPLNHPLNIKVNGLLFSPNVLEWPAMAATAYADIKNRSRTQPLAEQEMLIASQAIALDATLVRHNTRHFSRMAGGLRFENWLT
jgi:tRNA(fMet)-specific endonuclease VapC